MVKATLVHAALKKKYPILQDTLQTVLIETDECLDERSIYDF